MIPTGGDSWGDFFDLYIRMREIPTEFEKMCLRGESVRHSLSIFYSLINEMKAPREIGFIQKWETDLGVRFTEIQKKKSSNLTIKLQ